MSIWCGLCTVQQTSALVRLLQVNTDTLNYNNNHRTPSSLAAGDPHKGAFYLVKGTIQVHYPECFKMSAFMSPFTQAGGRDTWINTTLKWHTQSSKELPCSVLFCTWAFYSGVLGCIWYDIKAASNGRIREVSTVCNSLPKTQSSRWIEGQFPNSAILLVWKLVWSGVKRLQFLFSQKTKRTVVNRFCQY